MYVQCLTSCVFFSVGDCRWGCSGGRLDDVRWGATRICWESRHWRRSRGCHTAGRGENTQINTHWWYNENILMCYKWNIDFYVVFRLQLRRRSTPVSPTLPQLTPVSPTLLPVHKQLMLTPASLTLPQLTLASPTLPQLTLASPTLPQLTLASPTLPQLILVSPIPLPRRRQQTQWTRVSATLLLMLMPVTETRHPRKLSRVSWASLRLFVYVSVARIVILTSPFHFFRSPTSLSCSTHSSVPARSKEKKLWIRSASAILNFPVCQNSFQVTTSLDFSLHFEFVCPDVFKVCLHLQDSTCVRIVSS